MADRIKGITIEIGGDTTGLSKALSGVNKEIRGTQSQLKDVERLLKLDPSNTELLSQKQKLLTQAVEDTKSKLETLKTAESQVQQQFAEGKINQQQYDALKREIIETSEQLKTLEKQANNANITLQKISLAGDKFQEVGGKISGVGEKLLPLTGTVAAIGTVAVKTAADFDSAMSKVISISGAAGDEVEKLRDKAREMGEKTKFSASEAAEAFQYMAMAGWKTDDMLSGIDGIMNLAAASGEDLASTSDIVTDALTGFGLTAKDSAHFADILAAASSNANTNVSMMGETFKYVAPLAGSLGYSAEDTAVAVGLMANSGIKASQAGTQLRGALTNMVKPTDDMAAVMDKLGIEITNEDGSMKTLSETMDMLRSAFAISTPEVQAQKLEMYEAEMRAKGYGDELNGLSEEQKKLSIAWYLGTDAVQNLSKKEYKNLAMTKYGIDVTKEKLSTEQSKNLVMEEGMKYLDGLTESEQASAAATLFGKEAMSGMLAIINASETDYNKLTDAVNKSDGASKKMADTMNDNLNGQITILKSQLQELAISFGEILMPKIREIVTAIQGFIDKLNGLDDSTKETIAKILLIAAALAPILIFIGKTVTGIGSLIKAISVIGTAFSGASAAAGVGGTAISGFTAALSTIAAPVAIIIATVAALIAIFVTLYKNNEDFRNKVNELWGEIQNTISGIVDVIKQVIAEFITTTKELWDRYGDDIMKVVSSAFDFIGEIIVAVITYIKDILNVFLAVIKGDWSGAWEAMKTLVSDVVSSFKTIIDSGFKLLNNVIKLALDIALDIFNSFKEKAVEILNVLKQRITDKAIEIKNAVVNGISLAIDWIKELPGKAKQWGSDFIDGLVQGIKDKVSAVTDAIKDVADTITSYIHFSRPDIGPLREYEKWMPDMVSGLANGIKKNAWKITDQLNGLTGNMSYMLTGETASSSADLSKIEGLLGYYLPSLNGGSNIVLDDGTLVGKMMPNIDSGLTGYKDTAGREGT